MSLRANQPDTQADIDLRECMRANPPSSFIMKAGAGSGKTTSLIKGLSSVIDLHGERLRTMRQRIACITYTEIAAGEIWADVGNHPLVHVSTIHSFMWLLVKPFQRDVRSWVAKRLAEKIAELRETQANFGPRVQQRTKDKAARDLERLQRQQGQIESVKGFRYGTGSDYAHGILGHDDILKLVPYFIAERPLFRRLLASQFPFVFVDESQDTTDEVVKSLKTVAQDTATPFCLGFFGDPMQRIYATGSGVVEAEPGWINIPKPENFRCSLEVLKVANAIRRDGDELVQVAGQRRGPSGATPTPQGTAHLFILPPDNQRDANLIRVRRWMARAAEDELWLPGENEKERVKLLVIVHRMAANRLGFGSLYTALHDRSPEAIKNGFLDGSAWPIRPFLSFLIPLAVAHAEKRELDVMQLLRTTSPLLDKEALGGVDIARRLKEVRTTVVQISAAIMGESNETVGDVLRRVSATGILTLDTRLAGYLEPGAVQPAVAAEEEDAEELTREIATMELFLQCPAKELLSYQAYVSERSPFGTQQGIKGAEFGRVLVVLDDAEGTHTQFSYEKYLGLKALSDTDRKNMAEGKETTVDRTRRLFYVSCTRALKDLAVVLFTENPGTAKAHLVGLGLFPAQATHTQEVLL